MDDGRKYPNLEKCNPSLCISGRIRKCNRLIANIFRKHISPFDITSNQLTILFVTAKKQGRITQSALADWLVLEKSTVSRNIRLLLGRGLLQKSGGGLQITEEGKQLLEKVIPHWDAAMAEARRKLAPEGEAALGLLLGKLLV